MDHNDIFKISKYPSTKTKLETFTCFSKAFRDRTKRLPLKEVQTAPYTDYVSLFFFFFFFGGGGGVPKSIKQEHICTKSPNEPPTET
jgi:hypothetical protein